MNADPALIGRRCSSPLAGDIFSGVIRAVYQGMGQGPGGEPRPCIMYLVERMEGDGAPGELGGMWTTEAVSVVLDGKDAPELSMRERGEKIHVPGVMRDPSVGESVDLGGGCGWLLWLIAFGAWLA